jgi:aminoglycoside phosphotransferase (APT) family kinase protein
MSSLSAQAAPEGIRADRVSAWLQAHVEGARPPFVFELIAGGHSNLTYRFVDAAGCARVLRRPPLGHVLESAHDMGREHRIIAALGPTDVPVAPALGLCRDPEVNGAPFYVMGFVEGVVLHDAATAAALPLEIRAGVGGAVIDVLARLHRVDVDAIGLGDLGRKEAYVARQLRRWSRQWEESKTREVPDMEEAQRLLEERMPEQIGATIVHGDYRLGNFILDGARLAAVLDWELCTLGDPLADVGYLMNSWLDPGEAAEQPETQPTAAGGFATRAELLSAYEAATGRDLSRIDYYRAFSSWRSAAINEGVYARYIHGAMGEREDVDLSRFEQSTPRLARAVLELLEKAPSR